MEKISGYSKYGKKEIQIVNQTELKSFNRQRLRDKKTGRIVIPLDEFLGERHQGIRVVSQSVEEKVIEHALEKSYRKTENDLKKKFSKSSVQRKIFEKGKEAEKLEKFKSKECIIEEEKLKDASSAKSSYKENKGSVLRQLFGKIFGWIRLYIMIDGVGVAGQGEEWGNTKTRECKVAVILKQQGEKIQELGSFCTWNKVPVFRNILEWILFRFMPFANIVILSDGAKWIRQIRKHIPCLKRAIWILDWFHIKDRLLKMLRVFDIEEDTEKAELMLSLIWHGELEKCLDLINTLSYSKKEEEKEKQKSAVSTFKRYVNNQREGIVNYHSYQMRGYLVGSGYVEKRNDTMVKERMVRQGRMKWSKLGGEAMMQLLTAKFNGRLQELFV